MNCPLHNLTMQEKNGEYGVYHSHILKDVGFCNGKKIKPFAPKPEIAGLSNVPGLPEEVREPIKQRDYDAEARGKIRSLFIESRIIKQGLTPLTDEEKAALKQLVEIAMTGE